MNSPVKRGPLILVTGFGAFPGAPSNPTQAIVQELAKSAMRRLKRLGVDLRLHMLPVTFAETDTDLPKLLAKVRPDIVLHLGLAGRRKTITVETRGLNRLTTLRQDAARRCARAPAIADAGPFALPSRLPVARILRAVSVGGLPARPSISAGDYVCNHALYVSLANGYRAGFIHVPRPRGRRPLHRVESVRPTLAAMTRAVEVALLEIASDLRRHA